MTFDEILTEVYALTNRPDLVAETKTAVKASTLKAHMSDYYSKDIHETQITADAAGFVHGIDYISLVTNFRSLKYLRKYDAVTGDVGAFIEILEPEEVLDSYGNARTDIAYIAGRVLEIKSSTEISDLLMGCYVLPIVTEANFASWVASLYPYVIIYDAARVVFKMIGFDEQAASAAQLFGEQFTVFRQSALADVGH